ncbi:tail fiber assembly protein [Arsenophonus endosymbiont of Crataerina pallida]
MKKYRVLLNRVDISKTLDQFSVIVDMWPEVPKK